MSTRYFAAKDSAGGLISGLSPALLLWIYSDGSDPVVVDALPQPTISEIGSSGIYKLEYLPATDLLLQVDVDPGGSGGVANRYQEDMLSPDDEAVTELRISTIWSAATKKWMRIRNPVFSSSGKLESATIAFYSSDADAAAETSPLLEVAVDATYDAGDLLDSFVGLEPA